MAGHGKTVCMCLCVPLSTASKACAYVALCILHLDDAVVGHVISCQVGAHDVADEVLGAAHVSTLVAEQHSTAIGAEQDVGNEHAAVVACDMTRREAQGHMLLVMGLGTWNLLCRS